MRTPPPVASDDVFEAAKRRLDDYAQKPRGEVKQRAAPPKTPPEVGS